MTKARLQKVDNFLQFQQRLFPDGNIPTREEIKILCKVEILLEEHTF